jgi:hypothetical protein
MLKKVTGRQQGKAYLKQIRQTIGVLMNRQDIVILLDAAKKETGSDYKTAQRIGETRMNVSNWRNGKQAMPAYAVTLLADVAGLDAVEWSARALIAPHEGTAKGEKLKQALKKALLVTGAVIASSGAKAASIFLLAVNLTFTPPEPVWCTSYDVYYVN